MAGDHTPSSTESVGSRFCRSAVWTAWLLLFSGPHQARPELSAHRGAAEKEAAPTFTSAVGRIQLVLLAASKGPP